MVSGGGLLIGLIAGGGEGGLDTGGVSTRARGD